MAGLDIVALRQAVKARLDAANLTIEVDAGVSRNVAVYDYVDQVYQYPCIIIGHTPGAEIDYMGSLSQAGIAKLTLAIEVRCLAADGRSAQIALDRLLAAGTGNSSSSVFDALFADPTFSGTIANGTALTCTAPAKFTDGENEYWQSTFALTVRARKDQP